MNSEALHRAIGKRRQEKGLTITGLNFKSGVHYSHLYRIERVSIGENKLTKLTQ